MGDFTSQLQAVDVARAVMVDLFKSDNRADTEPTRCKQITRGAGRVMQGAVVQLTDRGARILCSPDLPLETLLKGRPVVETTNIPPLPTDPSTEGACENSPVGRQSDHPMLRGIATRHGRGPMWRLMGLLADAEATLPHRLPLPMLIGQTAAIPAARGSHALRITQTDGRVVRRTPTDNILAPGGALEQALSRLHPTPLRRW